MSESPTNTSLLPLINSKNLVALNLLKRKCRIYCTILSFLSMSQTEYDWKKEEGRKVPGNVAVMRLPSPFHVISIHPAISLAVKTFIYEGTSTVTIQRIAVIPNPASPRHIASTGIHSSRFLHQYIIGGIPRIGRRKGRPFLDTSHCDTTYHLLGANNRFVCRCNPTGILQNRTNSGISLTRKNSFPSTRSIPCRVWRWRRCQDRILFDWQLGEERGEVGSFGAGRGRNAEEGTRGRGGSVCEDGGE